MSTLEGELRDVAGIDSLEAPASAWGGGGGGTSEEPPPGTGSPSDGGPPPVGAGEPPPGSGASGPPKGGDVPLGETGGRIAASAEQLFHHWIDAVGSAIAGPAREPAASELVKPVPGARRRKEAGPPSPQPNAVPRRPKLDELLSSILKGAKEPPKAPPAQEPGATVPDVAADAETAPPQPLIPVVLKAPVPSPPKAPQVEAVAPEFEVASLRADAPVPVRALRDKPDGVAALAASAPAMGQEDVQEAQSSACSSKALPVDTGDEIQRAVSAGTLGSAALGGKADQAGVGANPKPDEIAAQSQASKANVAQAAKEKARRVGAAAKRTRDELANETAPPTERFEGGKQAAPSPGMPAPRTPSELQRRLETSVAEERVEIQNEWVAGRTELRTWCDQEKQALGDKAKAELARLGGLDKLKQQREAIENEVQRCKDDYVLTLDRDLKDFEKDVEATNKQMTAAAKREGDRLTKEADGAANGVLAGGLREGWALIKQAETDGDALVAEAEAKAAQLKTELAGPWQGDALGFLQKMAAPGKLVDEAKAWRSDAKWKAMLAFRRLNDEAMTKAGELRAQAKKDAEQLAAGAQAACATNDEELARARQKNKSDVTRNGAAMDMTCRKLIADAEAKHRSAKSKIEKTTGSSREEIDRSYAAALVKLDEERDARLKTVDRLARATKALVAEARQAKKEGRSVKDVLRRATRKLHSIDHQSEAAKHRMSGVTDGAIAEVREEAERQIAAIALEADGACRAVDSVAEIAHQALAGHQAKVEAAVTANALTRETGLATTAATADDLLKAAADERIAVLEEAGKQATQELVEKAKTDAAAVADILAGHGENDEELQAAKQAEEARKQQEAEDEAWAAAQLPALEDAFDGYTSDADVKTIQDILAGQSRGRQAALDRAVRERFGQSLQALLEDNLSEEQLVLAQALRTDDVVKVAIARLRVAEDKEALYEIFAGLSREQKQAVATGFELEDGRSIAQLMADLGDAKDLAGMADIVGPVSLDAYDPANKPEPQAGEQEPSYEEAVTQAEACFNELDAIFINRDALFQAMKWADTPLKMWHLRQAYFNHTGRELKADLEAKLDGNDLKETKAILSGDKVQMAVAAIQNATQGAGTDDEKFLETISELPPELQDQVAKELQRQTGYSLSSAVSDELGGSAAAAITAHMKGDRAKALAIEVDMQVNGGWKAELVQSVFGRDSLVARGQVGKVDPEKLFEVLDKMDPSDAARMANEYRRWSGEDLSEAVERRVYQESWTQGTKDLTLEAVEKYEAGLRWDARAAQIGIANANVFNSGGKMVTATEKYLKDLPPEEQEKARQELNRALFKFAGEHDTSVGELLADVEGEDLAAIQQLRTEGKVSDVTAIFRACDGTGTNVDALKDAFRGKTRKQIQALEAEWAARYPGEPPLKQRVSEEFGFEFLAAEVRTVGDAGKGEVAFGGGNEAVELAFLMRGKPEESDPDYHLSLIEGQLFKHDQMRGKGGALFAAEIGGLEINTQLVSNEIVDSMSEAGEIYDRHHGRMRKLYEAAKAGTLTEEQKAEIVTYAAHSNAASVGYAKRQGEIAEGVATGYAAVAGTAISIATAGTATPAVAALAGALASGTAGMAARALVMGGGYDAQDASQHAAEMAIEATVGLGMAKVTPFLQGAVKNEFLQSAVLAGTEAGLVGGLSAGIGDGAGFREGLDVWMGGMLDEGVKAGLGAALGGSLGLDNVKFGKGALARRLDDTLGELPSGLKGDLLAGLKGGLGGVVDSAGEMVFDEQVWAGDAQTIFTSLAEGFVGGVGEGGAERIETRHEQAAAYGGEDGPEAPVGESEPIVASLPASDEEASRPESEVETPAKPAPSEGLGELAHLAANDERTRKRAADNLGEMLDWERKQAEELLATTDGVLRVMVERDLAFGTDVSVIERFVREMEGKSEREILEGATGDGLVQALSRSCVDTSMAAALMDMSPSNAWNLRRRAEHMDQLVAAQANTLAAAKSEVVVRGGQSLPAALVDQAASELAFAGKGGAPQKGLSLRQIKALPQLQALVRATGQEYDVLAAKGLSVPALDALKTRTLAAVKAGSPVLFGTKGHFQAIVGLGAEPDTLLVRDPWDGKTRPVPVAELFSENLQALALPGASAAKPEAPTTFGGREEEGVVGRSNRDPETDGDDLATEFTDAAFDLLPRKEDVDDDGPTLVRRAPSERTWQEDAIFDHSEPKGMVVEGRMAKTSARVRERALEAIERLPANEQESVRRLLANAPTDAAAVMLWRALAHGADFDEVQSLAGELRTMSEEEILRKCTGAEVFQPFQDSCVPACLQAALHFLRPDWSLQASRNPEILAAEQAGAMASVGSSARFVISRWERPFARDPRLLEAVDTYGHIDYSQDAIDGTAHERIVDMALFRALEQYTGTRYRPLLAVSTANARPLQAHIVAALEADLPVMYGANGHEQLIVGSGRLPDGRVGLWVQNPATRTTTLRDSDLLLGAVTNLWLPDVGAYTLGFAKDDPRHSQAAGLVAGAEHDGPDAMDAIWPSDGPAANDPGSDLEGLADTIWREDPNWDGDLNGFFNDLAAHVAYENDVSGFDAPAPTDAEVAAFMDRLELGEEGGSEAVDAARTLDELGFDENALPSLGDGLEAEGADVSGQPESGLGTDEVAREASREATKRGDEEGPRPVDPALVPVDQARQGDLIGYTAWQDPVHKGERPPSGPWRDSHGTWRESDGTHLASRQDQWLAAARSGLVATHAGRAALDGIHRAEADFGRPLVTTERGVGSFAFEGRINVDPRLSSDVAAATLVHESYHVEAPRPAPDLTRDEYVRHYLREEAEAWASEAMHVRERLQAQAQDGSGSPDPGVAFLFLSAYDAMIAVAQRSGERDRAKIEAAAFAEAVDYVASSVGSRWPGSAGALLFSCAYDGMLAVLQRNGDSDRARIEALGYLAAVDHVADRAGTFVPSTSVDAYGQFKPGAPRNSYEHYAQGHDALQGSRSPAPVDAAALGGATPDLPVFDEVPNGASPDDLTFGGAEDERGPLALPARDQNPDTGALANVVSPPESTQVPGILARIGETVARALGLRKNAQGETPRAWASPDGFARFAMVELMAAALERRGIRHGAIDGGDPHKTAALRHFHALAAAQGRDLHGAFDAVTRHLPRPAARGSDEIAKQIPTTVDVGQAGLYRGSAGAPSFRSFEEGARPEQVLAARFERVLGVRVFAAAEYARGPQGEAGIASEGAPGKPLGPPRTQEDVDSRDGALRDLMIADFVMGVGRRPSSEVSYYRDLNGGVRLVADSRRTAWTGSAFGEDPGRAEPRPVGGQVSGGGVLPAAYDRAHLEHFALITPEQFRDRVRAECGAEHLAGGLTEEEIDHAVVRWLRVREDVRAKHAEELAAITADPASPDDLTFGGVEDDDLDRTPAAPDAPQATPEEEAPGRGMRDTQFPQQGNRADRPTQDIDLPPEYAARDERYSAPEWVAFLRRHPEALAYLPADAVERFASRFEAQDPEAYAAFRDEHPELEKLRRPRGADEVIEGSHAAALAKLRFFDLIMGIHDRNLGNVRVAEAEFDGEGRMTKPPRLVGIDHEMMWPSLVPAAQARSFTGGVTPDAYSLELLRIISAIDPGDFQKFLTELSETLPGGPTREQILVAMVGLHAALADAEKKYPGFLESFKLTPEEGERHEPEAGDEEWARLEGIADDIGNDVVELETTMLEPETQGPALVDFDNPEHRASLSALQPTPIYAAMDEELHFGGWEGERDRSEAPVVREHLARATDQNVDVGASVRSPNTSTVEALAALGALGSTILPNTLWQVSRARAALDAMAPDAAATTRDLIRSASGLRRKLLERELAASGDVEELRILAAAMTRMKDEVEIALRCTGLGIVSHFEQSCAIVTYRIALAHTSPAYALRQTEWPLESIGAEAAGLWSVGKRPMLKRATRDPAVMKNVLEGAAQVGAHRIPGQPPPELDSASYREELIATAGQSGQEGVSPGQLEELPLHEYLEDLAGVRFRRLYDRAAWEAALESANARGLGLPMAIRLHIDGRLQGHLVFALRGYRGADGALNIFYQEPNGGFGRVHEDSVSFLVPPTARTEVELDDELHFGGRDGEDEREASADPASADDIADGAALDAVPSPSRSSEDDAYLSLMHRERAWASADSNALVPARPPGSVGARLGQFVAGLLDPDLRRLRRAQKARERAQERANETFVKLFNNLELADGSRMAVPWERPWTDPVKREAVKAGLLRFYYLEETRARPQRATAGQAPLGAVVETDAGRADVQGSAFRREAAPALDPASQRIVDFVTADGPLLPGDENLIPSEVPADLVPALVEWLTQDGPTSPLAEGGAVDERQRARRLARLCVVLELAQTRQDRNDGGHYGGRGRDDDRPRTHLLPTHLVPHIAPPSGRAEPPARSPRERARSREQRELAHHATNAIDNWNHHHNLVREDDASSQMVNGPTVEAALVAWLEHLGDRAPRSGTELASLLLRPLPADRPKPLLAPPPVVPGDQFRGVSPVESEVRAFEDGADARAVLASRFARNVMGFDVVPRATYGHAPDGRPGVRVETPPSGTMGSLPATVIPGTSVDDLLGQLNIVDFVMGVGGRERSDVSLVRDSKGDLSLRTTSSSDAFSGHPLPIMAFEGGLPTGPDRPPARHGSLPDVWPGDPISGGGVLPPVYTETQARQFATLTADQFRQTLVRQCGEASVLAGLSEAEIDAAVLRWLVVREDIRRKQPELLDRLSRDQGLGAERLLSAEGRVAENHPRVMATLFAERVQAADRGDAALDPDDYRPGTRHTPEVTSEAPFERTRRVVLQRALDALVRAEVPRDKHDGQLAKLSSLMEALTPEEILTRFTGAGLFRAFAQSCAPTAAQVAKADLDPFYALRLHRDLATLVREQAYNLAKVGAAATRPESLELRDSLFVELAEDRQPLADALRTHRNEVGAPEGTPKGQLFSLPLMRELEANLGTFDRLAFSKAVMPRLRAVLERRLPVFVGTQDHLFNLVGIEERAGETTFLVQDGGATRRWSLDELLARDPRAVFLPPIADPETDFDALLFGDETGALDTTAPAVSDEEGFFGGKDGDDVDPDEDADRLAGLRGEGAPRSARDLFGRSPGRRETDSPLLKDLASLRDEEAFLGSPERQQAEADYLDSLPEDDRAGILPLEQRRRALRERVADALREQVPYLELGRRIAEGSVRHLVTLATPSSGLNRVKTLNDALGEDLTNRIISARQRAYKTAARSLELAPGETVEVVSHTFKTATLVTNITDPDRLAVVMKSLLRAVDASMKPEMGTAIELAERELADPGKGLTDPDARTKRQAFLEKLRAAVAAPEWSADTMAGVAEVRSPGLDPADTFEAAVRATVESTKHASLAPDQRAPVYRDEDVVQLQRVAGVAARAVFDLGNTITVGGRPREIFVPAAPVVAGEPPPLVLNEDVLRAVRKGKIDPASLPSEGERDTFQALAQYFAVVNGWDIYATHDRDDVRTAMPERAERARALLTLLEEGRPLPPEHIDELEGLLFTDSSGRPFARTNTPSAEAFFGEAHARMRETGDDRLLVKGDMRDLGLPSLQFFGYASQVARREGAVDAGLGDPSLVANDDVRARKALAIAAVRDKVMELVRRERESAREAWLADGAREEGPAHDRYLRAELEDAAEPLVLIGGDEIMLSLPKSLEPWLPELMLTLAGEASSRVSVTATKSGDPTDLDANVLAHHEAIARAERGFPTLKDLEAADRELRDQVAELPPERRPALLAAIDELRLFLTYSALDPDGVLRFRDAVDGAEVDLATLLARIDGVRASVADASFEAMTPVDASPAPSAELVLDFAQALPLFEEEAFALRVENLRALHEAPAAIAPPMDATVMGREARAAVQTMTFADLDRFDSEVEPGATSMRGEAELLHLLRTAFHSNWELMTDCLVNGLWPDGKAAEPLVSVRLMERMLLLRQVIVNRVLLEVRGADLRQDAANEPPAGPLTPWSTGNRSLTSDLDVGLRGTGAGRAVGLAAERLRELGLVGARRDVLGTSFYAPDHLRTTPVLDREAGRLVRDPNRLFAGLSEPARSRDARDQEIWGLVQTRRGMTAEEWDALCQSRLEANPGDRDLFEAAEARLEVYDRTLAAELARQHAEAAQPGTVAHAIVGLEPALGKERVDAALRVAALQRLYSSRAGELDAEYARLTGRKASEAGDPAFEEAVLDFRRRLCEHLLYADDAYLTEGAVAHVVVGMQLAQEFALRDGVDAVGVDLEGSEVRASFYEQLGRVSALVGSSETVGGALLHAAKYIRRMLDATLRLGIPDTREMAALRDLADRVTALLKAGTLHSESRADQKEDSFESLAARHGFTTLDELRDALLRAGLVLGKPSSVLPMRFYRDPEAARPATTPDPSAQWDDTAIDTQGEPANQRPDDNVVALDPELPTEVKEALRELVEEPGPDLDVEALLERTGHLPPQPAPPGELVHLDVHREPPALDEEPLHPKELSARAWVTELREKLTPGAQAVLDGLASRSARDLRKALFKRSSGCAVSVPEYLEGMAASRRRRHELAQSFGAEDLLGQAGFRELVARGDLSALTGALAEELAYRRALAEAGEGAGREVHRGVRLYTKMDPSHPGYAAMSAHVDADTGTGAFRGSDGTLWAPVTDIDVAAMSTDPVTGRLVFTQIEEVKASHRNTASRAQGQQDRIRQTLERLASGADDVMVVIDGQDRTADVDARASLDAEMRIVGPALARRFRGESLGVTGEDLAGLARDLVMADALRRARADVPASVAFYEAFSSALRALGEGGAARAAEPMRRMFNALRAAGVDLGPGDAALSSLADELARISADDASSPWLAAREAACEAALAHWGGLQRLESALVELAARLGPAVSREPEGQG